MRGEKEKERREGEAACVVAAAGWRCRAAEHPLNREWLQTKRAFYRHLSVKVWLNVRDEQMEAVCVCVCLCVSVCVCVQRASGSSCSAAEAMFSL